MEGEDEEEEEDVLVLFVSAISIELETVQESGITRVDRRQQRTDGEPGWGQMWIRATLWTVRRHPQDR